MTSNNETNPELKTESLSLMKLAFKLIVGFLVAVIVIFIIGLAIGFAGGRAPQIDPDVLWNQGSSGSAPAPTQTIEPEEVDPEETEINLDAHEAGIKAGELLKAHRENEQDFWAGFNEGNS